MTPEATALLRAAYARIATERRTIAVLAGFVEHAEHPGMWIPPPVWGAAEGELWDTEEVVASVREILRREESGR